MVSTILATNQISPEGRDHTLPMHIIVKCVDMIVARVLIDNGSTLNVYPMSTLERLNVDTFLIHLTTMIIKVFDGSLKKVQGKIELAIGVGPMFFTVNFQVIKVDSPWSEALEAIQNLLPLNVNGDLLALCTWPDQIRHWHKYRWTSPLHFIDTPDDECTFNYQRDCHDPHGVEDMCVAGAVQNFTSQLVDYREGSADRRYNMTEAFLFLSHFMGDIHQPMHVGFTSDEGGNTINLRWFRHKSNLHHVWDREIVLTALSDYYEKDMYLLQKDIEGNFTDGIWSSDVSSWEHCDDIISCVTK
ncbi:endonuclease 1-like [Quercus lobata]|uniref:endonuclease 1-like n=1 Tax=Quercus lobata TaxID=97700 RepID=UPI001245586E|nr:endonuclease 1-like [Quercus lobata]